MVANTDSTKLPPRRQEALSRPSLCRGPWRPRSEPDCPAWRPSCSLVAPSLDREIAMAAYNRRARSSGRTRPRCSIRIDSWLGIPPDEQPPNHYRLLGIRLFEDHEDAIANAADQRMAHLRTFQTGPNGRLSQRLLNEVAAARVCLLNPAKKAEYDACAAPARWRLPRAAAMRFARTWRS